MNKFKALLTRKNLGNAVFLIICVVIVVSPAAKALLIRAMMYIGLMRPPTQSTASYSAPAIPAKLFLKSSTDSLITMEKLKGKIVIINFWATWCPPCRAEMLALAELYKHYQKDPGIVILPVDVDGDLARSKHFMETYQYYLPVYKLAADLPAQLNFESIPTTIVLDSKSRIAAKHSGAANYADPAFYGFIDQLLKAAR
ncbi:TlpA family protein disulfide reductase [Mucilaginibacter ximonensis]|uniref:TlpA family protein disulfide reductase n=1 Tax=Mucilaginibacter ximonensis TaxID=538021 RepID=A0ABW5YFI1_9SPHI